MTDRAPSDPGLQPERTELAWRRTALALAIGSLLSLRVVPTALPDAATLWGFAPGMLGLVAACAFWFTARHRRLSTTAVLSGAHPAEAPAGGLLFALLTLSVAVGTVAFAFVLISALT